MMFHCIEAVSVFEGGGCQMPGDTETNDGEVRIIIQTMRSSANPAYSQTEEYQINSEQFLITFRLILFVYMKKI